jgi:glycosyltransferase involved in cell wall biosynthesis
LARLSKSGEPWKSYTIVGEGPEEHNLKRLSLELGIADRVYFKGRLPHKDALQHIASSDIFCLPSWHEAFGVVYLEAMACGKPVIGCRGQGAEDIIRHGVDGLLVQPKSVEALAEVLGLLLSDSDLARRLGDAGKSHVNEFSWERNTALYLDIYRKLCSTLTLDNTNG